MSASAADSGWRDSSEISFGDVSSPDHYHSEGGPVSAPRPEAADERDSHGSYVKAPEQSPGQGDDAFYDPGASERDRDRERERQREREREPALAVTSGYFFLFGFFGFCG